MGMITAIYDNLEISLEQAKNYLRLAVEEHADGDPSILETLDDALIEMLIKAAKRKADNFCQRELNEYPGEKIPEDVASWVLSIVARKYIQRMSGVASDQESGFGGISWKEEDFADLWPYRKIVGV